MSSDTEMGGASPAFPATRPSFVAGMRSEVPLERERAAEALVRAYWKPVYKYVRLRFRRGNEDAKDLTQGFLTHVLETRWLARFDARRGRFRSFLRLALDGYVANADKAGAREKRGGGRRQLALDFDGAEAEVAGLEPIASDSVEGWFDAEWRRGLFAAAVAELERSLAERGLAVRAAVFRRYALEDDRAERPTHAELGRELGLDAFAVNNHLAAARRAFREILLGLLREATSDDEEFQSELRALLGEDGA